MRDCWGLLDELHELHGLSWLTIFQLLTDTEGNNWRLSARYGLSPWLCDLARTWARSEEPSAELLASLQEKIQSELACPVFPIKIRA